MSATSSPQQVITKLLRRRIFASVPKDQQKILDQDGSWAVDSTSRQGVSLVPDHVLDTLIKHSQHGGIHEERVVNSGNGNRDDSDAPEEEDLGDAAVIGTEHVLQTTEVPQSSKSAPSSPSVQISWEPTPQPSPAQDSQPLIKSQVDQVVQGSKDPESSGPSFHPDPEDQVPSTESILRARFQDDEQEIEMDMDLPQAQEVADERVNLDPAPVQIESTPATTVCPQVVNETPSCAQPQEVVPATVFNSKTAAPSRRRRIMKAITFDSSICVTPVEPETCSVRRQSVTHLAEVDNLDTTLSSSLVPATCTTMATQTPTARIEPEESLTPLVGRHEAGTRPSAFRMHVAQSSESLQSTAGQERGPSSQGLMDTYTRFTHFYPTYVTTYSGNLTNFVKACLCLEHLEIERALREACYDDFVRAFSGGYLDYVRKAGPGQDPLPAIEWFNMLRGQLVFSGLVITKANLKIALQEHPEEVARARKYLLCEPPQETDRISEQPVNEPCETADQGTNAMARNTSPTHTPQASPPGPASRLVRTRPFPRHASKASALPPAVSTSSSRSRLSMPSQYFRNLKRESRGDKQGLSRPADRDERLREALRRARAESRQGSHSFRGSTGS